MELKLDKNTAKELYPTTPQWFQRVLKNTFGEEITRKRTFEDIKTYEDAVYEMPVDNENIIHDTDNMDVVAYKKLKHVLKVINDGWIPDWSDNRQQKYYPYYTVLPSGSGFSDANCSFASTFTSVGSHLCTDSSDKAMHMANNFKELYEQFLLIK
jgi:hypothetical protein